MKKTASFFLLIIFTFLSCSEDNDTQQKKVAVKLKFTHNWDGTPVTSSDFNSFKFTNKNGEKISIERLRYLVSTINLGKNVYGNLVNGSYNLIDIDENTGLEISFIEIPTGNHRLKFTFGFSDTNNQDGIYTDLNSVNFNVPGMLGGGYHYMQFDGKYKNANNQDANFNYHAIRAVDKTDPNDLKFDDTSFEVDLGNIEITNNTTIEIKMNIAEWFKNPNTWNLNLLNTVLMPNFDAQKLMSANGKSVFSLGEIIQ